MHKQCYTLCCKNNCCKQENSQWTNFVGCKNYTKDFRNHSCNGVTKGFVQNLKDKIINLQYDPQIHFARKPVKKKQKDYYCLMLRKINNLDKKLQNLEHLFISHLNHTPKEVLNSKDKEPLYDYMDFYDSVRSLVDVANRLKEDIIYKQDDNNVPNKNTLHLDDRIQVLDSELQNLYRHLEDLQNYTDGIKGRKQLYVKNRQDVARIYSGYRRAPKNKSYKLQEVVCTPKKYNEDCRNISSQCVECCYEADEDTPDSCLCSGCNISAPLCPDNRRYKVVECCRGGSISKDSDCSCVLCVGERKNGNKFRKKKLWISQSSSSCSCEMCISSNRKLCVQKRNSARIKIIKPVKKARNDEDFFRELEISYHELEPNENDKRKNQKNKKNSKNVNEDIPDVRVERTYYQDIGPTSNSMTAFRNKSGDSSILERTPEKYGYKQQQKVHSPTYNQRKDVKNVVYYEVAPNLNIITKKRNKGQVINSGQENNRKARKRKNKRMSKKTENNRNSPNRMFTVNIEDDNPFNPFEKVAKGKKTSPKYQNDQSSSDGENVKDIYVRNKKMPEQKNKHKSSGDGGKHLHIKIRQNKDLEERVIVEGNVRSPENKNKYMKNQLQLYHRKHGGFCHFTNGRHVNELYSNRKYSKYNGGLSESDSFETLEEYESSSESCSSQYKVFFCDDPNCVEKLDSDELIMLMNNTEMKYCGANPYKLSIHENTKGLKTDVCEKCTVKEKSITVTPQKAGNKKINEKDKFILKKEVVECSKCKNKANDKLSNIAITERNIKYVDSATENEKSEKFVTSNKSSSSKSSGSDKQNNKQEKEVKPNRSTIEKSNYVLAETDHQLQMDSDAVKDRPSNDGSKQKSTTVLAYNEMGQKSVFKASNQNNSTGNSPKPLELQGFGNLININIERGSYSVNQKPEMASGGKGTAVESKNLNSNPKIESKHKTSGVSNVKSINLDKTGESFSRNSPSKVKASSFHQKNNPSSSDMNLVIDNEREFKGATLAKSEVFINPQTILRNASGSKMKNESKNKITTEIIVSYMEAENNAGDARGKGVQLKTGNKNISNRVTGEHLENALNELITSDYIYEEGHNNLSTNSMTALKKNVVRPKVSISKLKRSRLKHNKKFGLSLSKVSSVHSVIIQQATLYPGDKYAPKRPNIYNPTRRSYKQTKRRPNPRIIPLMKENSLSGIVKPQIKNVEKESYNNLKIPANDLSRYKVGSISNYLSSTVVSESSYCTLNWETVANKLKEEDKFLNNIP